MTLSGIPGRALPGAFQPGQSVTDETPITPKAGSDTTAVGITDAALVVVVTEISRTDTLTVSVADTATVARVIAASDAAALSLTEATPTLVKEAAPFQTPTEVRSHMSATIRQAAPTTADVESIYLRLDGTTGSEMRALLDVGRTVPIGVGAQVVRAELHLIQAEAAPGAYTLTAEPLNGEWTAEAVTWNTAPPVRAESSTRAVAIGGTNGTRVTIDLTAMIANSVAADDAAAARWYGIRLRKSTAGTHRFHSSFSAPDFRPVLEIEWSVPPVEPEDLQPAGGRAVSETKPELVAHFFDVDAEDVLSAGRWEIATADDFTTLTYDSGWTTQTVPRFDLAAPPAGAAATPALATATPYFWRVTFRDNHGLESPVSDAAEFFVATKGTLTLTSPSGATVTSPTPTITHTFTGATQESVEVEVERRVAGAWIRHYHLPRYVSTSTSHTVPNEYRLQEGEDYRVIVRVWDSVDRADMPGDRAFNEVSREVTLTALS